MIDVSYEINGRKVQPNQIGEALENAALKDIVKQLRNKLGRVKSSTGERLKITFRGRKLSDLKMHLEGPEELIEKAEQILG